MTFQDMRYMSDHEIESELLLLRSENSATKEAVNCLKREISEKRTQVRALEFDNAESFKREKELQAVYAYNCYRKAMSLLEEVPPSMLAMFKRREKERKEKRV